jgi:O-succinylbenzoate synthase
MNIESIVLRQIQVKLKTPFETSFGKTWERRVVLVEVICEGLSGWGEVTAGEGPFYNSETTDTSWLVLEKFIVPLVAAAKIRNPAGIPDVLRVIRGHGMAKAALENALWDVEAQRRQVPLAKLLGGTRTEINCGVSIGIQDSPERLVAAAEREVGSGYQRIKIKIKPQKDLEYMAAVRKRFPEILLSVDANSAYRLEEVQHLKKFDDYGLLMMEQPLSWDDIYDHSLLQPQIKTAICLDESIHNSEHARAAIEMGACRIINVKLGRVGGHSEAKKVEQVSRARKVPVWCGGMLETGVGRAHNIAMSALEGFVLPGDVSASQRYWEEDIIEPEVEVSKTGTITIPTASGLGYAVRTRRIEQLTVRKEVFPVSNAQVSVV